MKKIFALIAIPALGVAALAGPQLTRAGYESPSYEVTAELAAFEIRNYPEMAVVSTRMAQPGEHKQKDQRFMRLFRYIDRGNEAGQKIAMTTPVFMESGGSGGAMSFVIPTEVSAEGAPGPKAENVFLTTISGGKYAALRFRGARSESTERAAAKKLREAMAKEGVDAAKGEPMFAYYDPPWTPRPLRRNEVLIRVKE